MNSGLVVSALDFGWGERSIGRGVSFHVAPGEIVCLLGANGGGKTTLFKTILGLLPPQGGAVTIDGEDIAKWPARRLAQRLAYVPQAGAGQFAFTIREMALMGRTAHHGPFSPPSAGDFAAVDQALADLGISHLAERDWLRVSGGERQLALIARALAQQAHIVILDEPTANLDFGNQLRVVQRLRLIADRGLAVVFSTHHPEQAFACADRVAVLHGGGLMAYGSARDVITPEMISTVYGVDVEIVTAGSTTVCVPSAVS
jgi:iron complex transport system ATP-binding protein